MQIPRRLISLVPSTTESVCKLGARDRLVGCTRYCTEPVGDLTGVVRIGGTKNPDLEQVLSLRPDLVLANAEENRPEDLAWLEARVQVLCHTPCTVSAAVADLRSLAACLGAVANVQPFLQRIDAHLAAAAAGTSKLRAYYAIWAKPWMSINRTTFVHDVLHWCGAVNVCADQDRRYPSVTPAAAVEAGVEVVLLASEPWPFDTEQCDRLQAQRAFGTARLVLCDGRDFCWHGVHMSLGLGRVRALLRSLHQP